METVSGSGGDLFNILHFDQGVLKETAVPETPKGYQPKDMEELRKNFIEGVKKAGSKGRASVQAAQNCLEQIKSLAQNTPPKEKETLEKNKATLLKYITAAKQTSIENKQKQWFSGIRIFWSKQFGSLGKLQKMEKELAGIQSETTPPPKSLTEAAREQPTKKTPEQLTAIKQKAQEEGTRIREKLGIPEPISKKNEGNFFPKGLCKQSFITKKEIQNEIQLYHSLLFPSELSENKQGVDVLRSSLDPQKLFQLRATEDPKKFQVISTEINNKEPLEFTVIDVEIPKGKTEKEFADSLKADYGQPLDDSLERRIQDTVLATPLPSRLETVEDEQQQVKEMVKTLHSLREEIVNLSSAYALQAKSIQADLLERIETLKEEVVKDLANTEQQRGTYWKTHMPTALEGLVSLEIDLNEKMKIIEARGSTKSVVEGRAHAFQKEPLKLDGLCRIASEKDIQEHIKKQATILHKHGKDLLQEKENKLFQLGMDYEHPDRLFVVAAEVGKKGTCTFKRYDIAIQPDQPDDKYILSLEDNTKKICDKEGLIKELTKRFGEPLGGKFEAGIPYLGDRSQQDRLHTKPNFEPS